MPEEPPDFSTIKLDNTPNKEVGANPVVHVDYEHLQAIEAKAYIHALIIVYGEPPAGCWYALEREAIDIGTYTEVVLSYNHQDECARAYARRAERGLDTWAEAGMKAPILYHGAAVVQVTDDPAQCVLEAGASSGGRPHSPTA